MSASARLKLLQTLFDNGVDAVSMEHGVWKLVFGDIGFAKIDPKEGTIVEYHNNDTPMSSVVGGLKIFEKQVDRKLRNLDTQYKRKIGYYVRYKRA